MSQQKPGIELSVRTFTPSFRDIVFVTVFIMALASGAKMLSLDSDLGRHLTIGGYVLDTGMVPTRDLFSHTLLNQPRPPYEWLSQVLFALTNRLLGLDGVILFTAMMLAITFALIFEFTNRRCRSPILALSLTFLTAAASSIHWLPRPHIMTFLLLAVWVEHLEQLSMGKPLKVAVFFLVMLFWANLHGGFLFGILAWCAYFAGWLWTKWQKSADNQTGWKLLIVGVTALLASVSTPDFWHNWEAVLDNNSSFILSRTVETMPPDLTTPSVFPFTILLTLIMILFMMNHKTFAASHFFLLSGLGIASLLMARNIPLFVITCTPIAATLASPFLGRLREWSQLEARFSGFGKGSRWHLLPILVVLLTLIVLAEPNWNSRRTIFEFNSQIFPVEAMNWLERHPQYGRMFNEFNWGGYILYRAWPQYPVFLDSQSDFYGEALMREYDRILYTKGDWEGLLEKYRVRWAIIPPNAPLAQELMRLGWKVVYQDSTAVILVKSSERQAPFQGLLVVKCCSDSHGTENPDAG